MPEFIHPSVIAEKLSPEALYLEPRLVYDRALVGYTDEPHDRWPRQTHTTVAVYDTALCIAAIQWWNEGTYEEAAEYFEFNVAGAWLGEGTPTFTRNKDFEEEEP